MCHELFPPRPPLFFCPLWMAQCLHFTWPAEVTKMMSYWLFDTRDVCKVDRGAFVPVCVCAAVGEDWCEKAVRPTEHLTTS